MAKFNNGYENIKVTLIQSPGNDFAKVYMSLVVYHTITIFHCKKHMTKTQMIVKTYPKDYRR